MHSLRLTLATLIAAATLTGCSGGDDDAAAPASPSSSSSSSSESATDGGPTTEYVALGDSYAAAPGVPETSGVDGCFRSTGNYANLLTETLTETLGDDVDLTDVTCSGATTSDVITKQVPALSRSTDLVTIGIGGNDSNLFTEVLGACLLGTPCTATTEPRVEELLPGIETNIGDTLDAIVAAAPRARVVVVGYPDLVPDQGSCPDLIPLVDSDIPLVDSVNRELSGALRAQARERDLDYVDVYAASQGHDICADEPWVNGQSIAPDGTIPFHPFAVEQAAVAAMISRLV